MKHSHLLQCGLLVATLAMYSGVRPAHAFLQDHDDHGDHGERHGDDHHDWNNRGGDRGDDHRGDDHGRAYGHNQHPDYRFRQEDREHFRGYYRDADRYRDLRDRRHYYEGERLEGDWRNHFEPVPEGVYRELPPPPPGYVFGYSDGYAVAYNPTTRIIADVIDLAAAASNR